MVTIKIKDAVKQYGDQTVLKQVSLELESGVIYGFVGQNGIGRQDDSFGITCSRRYRGAL